MNDKLPSFQKTAFQCPLCSVFAKQIWYTPTIYRGGSYGLQNIFIVECDHCHKYSIWLDGKIVYPVSEIAIPPNPDMPDDIKEDYNEAGQICNLSPRAAAALLRLAIEKLTLNLLGNKDTGNLNDNIGILTKNFSPQIQQALDIVRVVGNEAVHPGQIDLKDDLETVNTLFLLLNVITEATISIPKKIKEMYEKLPEEKLKGIEERNKKFPKD